MNKILLLLLLISFCHSRVLAQSTGNGVNIGTNYTINSKILNQEREIQIYLPDSYTKSSEKYPVLYILDSQWYFASGVAIQKALRTPGAIPEMIIVGIKNSNPLRRTLFGDEKEKFTNFLTDEVIAYIDSKYRTSNDRVIFGWEDAAYYISELILVKHDVFNCAIVTNGGNAGEDLVKNFTSDKDIYLFMANSRKDIYNISQTDEFNEILKENNPDRLIWQYQLFNDEQHVTLPHLSIYKGLKYYYHNYGTPIFESIQEYIDLGEMDYLNSYFKGRAKRFGGSDQLDDHVKNRLIWLAWNRNHFDYFNLFMNEFKDVLTTQRYASAYWQNRFGQFYLKHKDYQNAIHYFNAGLTKYPGTNFEEEMKKGLKEAENGSD